MELEGRTKEKIISVCGSSSTIVLVQHGFEDREGILEFVEGILEK